MLVWRPASIYQLLPRHFENRVSAAGKPWTLNPQPKTRREEPRPSSEGKTHPGAARLPSLRATPPLEGICLGVLWGHVGVASPSGDGFSFRLINSAALR